MRTLCQSVMDMPRSGIRVIMDLAAEQDEVFHMELGEPGFDTPEHIKAAACRAIGEGITKYTANIGFPSLREAILKKVKGDGIDASYEQIAVTPGSVFALAAAVMTVSNPGDEILISDPGWPNYYMQIVAMERKAVFYPLHERNGFEPDVDELEKLVSNRTRAIIINTPSNPTGAVFSAETVRRLVDFAERHDIYVISDEVYEKIIYEGSHHSPLRIDPRERVISINGFSKSYAMTGWRIGWYVAPVHVTKQMNKLLEPYVACASSVSQKAAEAAILGPQECVAEMVKAYAERRNIVVETLAAHGFEFSRPKGAFYLLVNVSAAGLGSYDYAKKLLMETGVAAAPGRTFGEAADAFLRLSFCGKTAEIQEGIRRFCRFHQSLT
jgi:aspartate aminotransferase/aminotransferase